MASSSGGSSGPGRAGDAGPVRQSMERLIAAEQESQDVLDEFTSDILRSMREIEANVRSVSDRRGPLSREIAGVADDIEQVAATTEDRVQAAPQETAQAYATEVHALVDLLGQTFHQQDALPPLDLNGLHPGSMANAFPVGYARDYVSTVAGELHEGAVTAKNAADAYPLFDAAAAGSSYASVVDACTRHRTQVERLLKEEKCHAIEIHGPHVTDAELEFRAGWTRPPDRGRTDHEENLLAHRWKLEPDNGMVRSKHGLGHEATRFTVPEALARPLEAVLDVLEQHPNGFEGYLDQHFASGVAGIFVRATDAGLGTGDTFGYRGAGTGTDAAAADWKKMRRGAMLADVDHLDPVRTLPFDPMNEGNDPGVCIVFVRKSGSWSMVTAYPASTPQKTDVSLEDLP